MLPEGNMVKKFLPEAGKEWEKEWEYNCLFNIEIK